MWWCFTLIPTAALLRSLQWVSYRRVPSGHCAAPHDAVHLTHDAVHLTPHPIRPPSGNMCGGVCIYPQLRCSAACSGFHIDVSLQDTAQLTHGTVQHVHDIANLSSPPYVPRSRTDRPKPTASCEAAPLWGIANLPSPQMFRDAGPTIRNPLQAAKQRRCGSSNPPTPYRFRDAGPTIRNPLQAAKQRRCGYKQPSHLPIGSA